MRVYQCKTGIHAYRGVLSDLLSMRNGHSVRGLGMYSEILGCYIEVKDGRTLDFDMAGRPNNRAYKITEAIWDLGPEDSMFVL
jgi:hypothetical protein